MISKADPVGAYLDRYAEPESRSRYLDHLASYEQVIVIPVFDEPLRNLIRVFNDVAIAREVLLILVINSPPGKAALSQALFDELRDSNRPTTLDEQTYFIEGFLDRVDLLLVDRFSEDAAIPTNQGVGLARKIGCDIATRLINIGTVKSPFIFSTDADAVLPAEYFNVDLPDAAAVIFPFKHTGNRLPMLLYELSLRYYVAGLSFARSPYAHYTVGSTLVLDHLAYAKVRGFPKRRAGEDFYILNKIAKVGKIESLTTPTILLSDRESDRVPFGTGPGLKQIRQLAKPIEEYLFYNPIVFEHLKQCLETMKSRWHQRSLSDTTLSEESLSALASMGLGQILDKAWRQYKSEDAFERHLTEWFDGFRTLKFIHYLRDHGDSSVPLAMLGQHERYRDLIPEALGG